MELYVRLESEEEKLLKSLHFTDKSEEINIYRFVDAQTGGRVYLKVELIDNQFKLLYKSEDIVEENPSIISKLEELFWESNSENFNIGTEDTEYELEEDEETPYDPERIRVETKQLSLRQIYDMIEAGDIDLTPDFQRKLVWDEVRKSRLIESVLLRIPLPIFYFAQDEEGRMSVVDGLQRLSTIHSFMKNEFSLNNLEYLQDKCKGKYYTNSIAEKAIEPKYFRWLNLTQITVNIIDSSSPNNLKYDIFRRINTGGQPLNSQEIRNCLSSQSLRKLLRTMVGLESFKTATGNSLKDIRMESQEMALRFILFYEKYHQDSSLNNYSGKIDSELNTLTEILSKDKSLYAEKYITLFDSAMKSSFYLFGKHAFRKSRIKDIEPNARRQLINKVLFVSCSVILSDYDFEVIQQNNQFEQLMYPLANKISEDQDLFEKLTWSTNAKANHQIVFNAIKDVVNQSLNI